MLRKNTSYLLALLWLLSGVEWCHALDVQLGDAIAPERLAPRGERYEATVPDTLDLGERAMLSVHALTGFLNQRQNHAPYGHGYFNVRVPYMTSIVGGSDDGSPNWGKITEALMMVRVMSGADRDLDIDRKTLEGAVKMAADQGCVPNTRVMHTLMVLYQRDPDPKIWALLQRMADDFHKGVKYEGDDGAYYYDGAPLYNDGPHGMPGYGANVRTQGDIIRALTRWHEMSGDKKALDLAGKLVNYTMRQTKFWAPETDPKAVVSAEHAHFSGHPHENMVCMMGLLRYAQATNNPRVKQFVRDGYEYLRNWGIARIGMFGELCAVADMTYLAIKLSETGVGDYWDDADQYVRNVLTDRQITDPEKLRRAVAAEPILARIQPGGADGTKPIFGIGVNLDKDWLEKHTYLPLNPDYESEEQVIERNVGGFLSDGGWPNEIPKPRLQWTICCPGNATQAIFYAWDSIVHCRDGHAQINLLLNRASQWLDVDSYLPFEGKVVIRNKTAQTVSVRIPRWVDRSALTATVNGKPASPFWTGNYQVFVGLEAKDQVIIQFLVSETRETYTVKWKKTDFWQEGTDPGKNWKNEHPEQFTFTFKGDTVIDVEPRAKDAAYPTFQRNEYKAPTAPMKKVSRFVSDVVIKW